MPLSRRSMLGGLASAVPITALSPVAAATPQSGSGARAIQTGVASKVYDQIGLEWVMDIIPFCSEPEAMGDKSDQTASDGDRHDIWPIVGGSFYGRGIKGTVVPGGGDFPVVRPDGAFLVDALYRLKTDDGYQIIIHNRGLGIQGGKFRLLPTFNVAGRKYAWLRKSIYVATLVYPVPPEIPVTPSPAGSNGRLIQVFRLT